MEKRVLLGMSGGTDSSVAAIKLQDAGYEVAGVTLRLHDDGGRDAEEAARLADRLGIEHFEYDARKAFEAQVVRYFTEEYLTGRTLVPCTVCNNRLKWPLLARLADERGISCIATGHYVRKVCRDGRWYIAPAADADKDQSFFLWGLKQGILKRMLLPMGELTKAVASSVWRRRRIAWACAFARWTIALFCAVLFRLSFCQERESFLMKTVLFWGGTKAIPFTPSVSGAD